MGLFCLSNKPSLTFRTFLSTYMTVHYHRVHELQRSGKYLYYRNGPVICQAAKKYGIMECLVDGETVINMVTV